MVSLRKRGSQPRRNPVPRPVSEYGWSPYIRACICIQLGLEMILSYVFTGRLVCWRSYFLPHRQSSQFATRSCSRIVTLSATIGRDARPYLTANRIFPAGFYPIYSPTTGISPRIPPLGFGHPSERLLARRTRMQSVCGALCHSRSRMGSILYGDLPAVRSPSEASAVSTILFRGS